MTADALAERLTADDVTMLNSCERVIVHGLRTFVEVGEALATIRDSRLYRSQFATFEAYCRDRWGMSVAQGKRLVAASEVAKALAPTGASPANEAQARELAPLLDNPPALRRVVKRATLETDDGTLPTAAKLRELAAPEIEKMANKYPTADDMAEQRAFVESLGKSDDPEGDRRRQLAARLGLGVCHAVDRLLAEFTVAEWSRFGPPYIRRYTPDVGPELVEAAAVVARLAAAFESAK